MSLEAFGFSERDSLAFAPFRARGLAAGRVWTYYGTRVGVWTEAGSIEAVQQAGLDDIAAGDWVVLDGARIEALLPRRSKLSRRAPAGGEQILAANVDVLFVVTGLDADFNLRRLERYLVLAAESGCRPVVLLNKADICPDREGMHAAARAVAGVTPVELVSALHDDPLPLISSYLAKGETAALVGSSGAGKSTLVNRLQGTENQLTQAVRESDSRGRHTTTRRELILLDNGWLLMDTPGLREVGVWADEASVDAAFDDIAALAALCRFRDCRHRDEPGCAVREAIEPARLRSYQKLLREAQHSSGDREAQLQKKQLWKRLHKQQKRFYKMRGR